jgi:hypothetical protein
MRLALSGEADREAPTITRLPSQPATKRDKLFIPSLFSPTFLESWGFGQIFIYIRNIRPMYIRFDHINEEHVVKCNKCGDVDTYSTTAAAMLNQQVCLFCRKQVKSDFGHYYRRNIRAVIKSPAFKRWLAYNKKHANKHYVHKGRGSR